MQSPGLIELRKTISREKLAILAISREDPTRLKKFVDWAKINYTVLLNPTYMPAPYNNVTSIPSSFFINPEGKIKLATLGVLPLESTKAILLAE
jgi:peroxiredoxin